MIFLTNLGENDKFLQFFHKARIFGETILPYFRLDYDTLCNVWFLKKYISQPVTNNRLLQYPLPGLESC